MCVMGGFSYVCYDRVGFILNWFELVWGGGN
jgi:hypothetical protein